MQKGTHHTKKARKAISKAIRELHAEGVYDYTHLNTWTDELRAKRSRQMKKFWREVRKGVRPHPHHTKTGRRKNA